MKKRLQESVLKKEDGAIAIMFAFLLVPLIALAAMTIEVGQAYYANTRLAYAVDAAAVAAAKYDLAQAQTNANNIFYANFPPNYMGITTSPVVSITQDQTNITVTASGNMPTILSKVFEINSMRLRASATVLRSLVGLEVALVLDETSSMLDNNKLQALKNAANNFLDVIYGVNNNTRLNTGVAIVPYAMVVNVGNNKQSWLSDPTTASNTANFPTGQPWKGCVKTRYTLSGTNVTVTDWDDRTPTTQKFETFFAQSTWPYHPTNQSWDNDWSISGNNVVVRNAYSIANVGPNCNCGDAILPMINDKSILKNKINGLTVQMGGTDPSRIVWGWRVLSPLWDGLWTGGLPIKSYRASNNIKAVVMMTDGVTEVPTRSYTGTSINGYESRSNPAVIGTNRLSTKRFYNTTTQAAAIAAVNASFLQTCAAMKAQGIQIYTVLFQVNDSTTENMYRTCATTPANYYKPSTTQEIYDAFSKIASSLNRIRITQ